MTEFKREGVIPGEISKTGSSDEEIQAKLEAARDPLYGLNITRLTDAEVVSESLPETPVNQLDSSSKVTPIDRQTRLNTQDSGPMSYLVSFRSKRKAA